MPVRHSIAFIHSIAKEHGGKCLSLIYENDDTVLKWMCRRGHTWEASYTIIRQGGWCVQCAKLEVNDEKLEELKQIAKQKRGKCLSAEYINNHTYLQWQCKHGHKWEATSRVIKETWCPYCSGLRKTLKDMQQKAAEHGGKCLSKVYVNQQTKLKWQCKRHHQWRAIPGSIWTGKWCRRCAGIEQSERQRIPIAVYQRHAAKMKGKLLSASYPEKDARLEWQCSKGHTWKAMGTQLVNAGSWCPYCAGKAKHTIEEMQQAAIARGGKCLSKSYHNQKTKLLWECRKKHRWKAIGNNVINNHTWCPVCARDIIKLNLFQYRKN